MGDILDPAARSAATSASNGAYRAEIRRKIAAPKDRLPLRFYIMYGLGAAVVFALGLNTHGSMFNPGPGPLAVATVFVLATASVIFIGNYSSYLGD